MHAAKAIPITLAARHRSGLWAAAGTLAVAATHLSLWGDRPLLEHPGLLGLQVGLALLAGWVLSALEAGVRITAAAVHDRPARSPGGPAACLSAAAVRSVRPAATVAANRGRAPPVPA